MNTTTNTKPLVMTFKIEGAGKVIEGTITTPDDDGTTHLPMMIHGTLKEVVQKVPEIAHATSLTITAAIKPNVRSELSRPAHGSENQKSPDGRD